MPFRTIAKEDVQVQWLGHFSLTGANMPGKMRWDRGGDLLQQGFRFKGARNWRISCVARSEVGAASWEYFQMDSMHYLFAAFLAIWIILALYLFSLHSREKKLREEIERLKRTLENR